VYPEAPSYSASLRASTGFWHRRSIAAHATVSVCISTYRRPDGLRDLLASLDAQTTVDLEDVRIVVVDNDPDGSASAVIDWARDHTRLHIVSDIERRPGVSYVRNRALALAGDPDFIAIIDDDTTAAPDWLASLLAAQRRYHADVVGGRVNRTSGDPSREWVTGLEVFTYPGTLPSGTTVSSVDLANCLIRRDIVDDDPFDPALALIGGEDTKLFLSLTRDGCRIVTSAEARTNEVIAPDRTTMNWIVRRGFRLGSSWTMIERAVLGTPPLERTARAFGRMGRGVATAAGGIVTLRRARVVDGLLDITQGAGMIAGLFGVTLAEYGRDGRRLIRIDASSLTR